MWEIILIILIVITGYFLYQKLGLRIVMGGHIDTRPTLHGEYTRWLAIQDMMRAMNSYEGLNILERWLVASANAIDGKDPVLRPSAEVDAEFIRECKEKRIGNRLDQIHKIRARFLQGGYARYAPDAKPIIIANEIKYGRFHAAIPDARLQQMLRLADSDLVVICALRYGCLIQRGQQWSIPFDVYKSLDGSIEGFASPFNSQNMMLGRPFCSLFLDTDAVFGSLGPFFSAAFDQSLPIIVNPPFVPKILERAALRCDSEAKNGRSLLFIGPDWTGAAFQSVLNAYPQTVLEPGKYSYQNIEGKMIVAKFLTRVYSLGPDPPNLVW
jgi:hypothetical protein